MADVPFPPGRRARQRLPHLFRKYADIAGWNREREVAGFGLGPVSHRARPGRHAHPRGAAVAPAPGGRARRWRTRRSWVLPALPAWLAGRGGSGGVPVREARWRATTQWARGSPRRCLRASGRADASRAKPPGARGRQAAIGRGHVPACRTGSRCARTPLDRPDWREAPGPRASPSVRPDHGARALVGSRDGGAPSSPPRWPAGNRPSVSPGAAPALTSAQ